MVKSKPKKLSRENIIVAIAVVILFFVVMSFYYLTQPDSKQIVNDSNFTVEIIKYNCTQPIIINGYYYCNLDNLTKYSEEINNETTKRN